MLYLISVNELPDFEPQFREQFCLIDNKVGSQLDYERTLEQLYDERMFLWVDSINPSAGFVLLKPMTEVNTDTPYLQVVAAYHEGQDGLNSHNDQIEQIAKAIGAQFIQFQSRRKGFLKMASELGFKPDTIIYRKEI